ncbi:MAG: hypothetical protein KatS3mg116_2038 [Elioraea sp.]|nr:MAG: hypothetical protein KatS3mg116_2038 [Elioraea sp.]
MTSAPGRVQLRRVRGWRLPPDTVQVDRATRWGNPFRCDNPADAVAAYRAWLAGDADGLMRLAGEACGFAVVGFSGAAARQRILCGLPKLRGRRLACWCSPDSPCHADVLLELADADSEAAVG